MPKDNSAGPVEDTGATAAAAATPVTQEALPTPGDVSTAVEVVSEPVKAAEGVLARVEADFVKVEQVVREWVGDHFSNSPVSRATEALNYLRQHAVPDLLNRIKEL